MKKKLFFVASLFFAMASYAQDNYFFVNAKIGAAIPVNMYRYFATDGPNIGGEAAYLFSDRKMSFGPLLSVGYFTNKDVENTFLIINTPDRGSYRNVFCGAGFLLNIHVSGRFNIGGHMALGLLHSTRPEKMFYTSTYHVIELRKSTSNTFTIKPGIGGRFLLGERLVLSADMELLLAEQNFKFKIYGGRIDHQVGVFIVNTGLGIRL